MRADHLRRTHALLRPETAVAAVEALRDSLDRAAVEGLVELVSRARVAREATAALAVLEGCDQSIVLDALLAALESPFATARIAAIQAVVRRPCPRFDDPLRRVLRRDSSGLVRRAALDALAARPEPVCWHVLEAATDPHWRVRHALIKVLLGWGEREETRRTIDERLTPWCEDNRARGLREYLRYRWSGVVPGMVPEPFDPAARCPFWDWDPAVLARDLARMGAKGRREAIDAMPFLLGHAEPRIRTIAAQTLLDAGQVRHLAEALTLLDEPRSDAVAEVGNLFAALDLDRTEEAARFLLHQPAPTPAQFAWAIDQAGGVFPCEEEEAILVSLLRQAGTKPVPVRQALARLASRWDHAEAAPAFERLVADSDPEVQREALPAPERGYCRSLDESTLQSLFFSTDPLVRAAAARAAVRQRAAPALLARAAEDEDARVRACLAESLAACPDAGFPDLLDRLQGDVHPHVRAAALTPARATALVAGPQQETSWHVLARAARLAKVPFWTLEPEQPWQPEPRESPGPELLRPAPAAPPHVRRLGPDGPRVSVVGISGHYGLPVEGFVRAVESGVNLMFWEPNYQTMTEFFARLAAADRDAIHLVAGTFEAEEDRVRKDAERALRALKVERLSLFLLFWVQSWRRITPDVREALQRLKEEGLIAAYGLSTHSRPLAVEAMESGWDPVMVRYSAAHRGAEQRVFPRAAELGTSLITFNATCYGRMLEGRDGRPGPSAADCYRFALSPSAVRLCLSAPATLEQLDDSLSALRNPELPQDRRQILEEHGASLYREETTFRKLVRAL